MAKRKPALSLKIDISEGDIRDGIGRSCFFCPIATATNDAAKEAGIELKPGCGAFVWPEGISLLLADGRELDAALPEQAAKFIEAFDEDIRSVEPFSFTAEFF